MFNLEDMSIDELANLQNQCSSILSQKIKEEKDNELHSIKEKYEGKYIILHGTLYHIKEINNRYSYDCSKAECSHSHWRGTDTYIIKIGEGADLLKADTEGNYPIEKGVLTTAEEAEDFLNEMFKEIKEKF